MQFEHLAKQFEQLEMQSEEFDKKNIKTTIEMQSWKGNLLKNMFKMSEKVTH